LLFSSITASRPASTTVPATFDLGHHPPLVQDNWVYLIGARRTIRVLNAYIDAYGIDTHIALTVGGYLMTRPIWYVATKLRPFWTPYSHSTVCSEGARSRIAGKRALTTAKPRAARLGQPRNLTSRSGKRPRSVPITIRPRGSWFG
jgi:hypothetical protein